jgi:hypothetical protein
MLSRAESADLGVYLRITAGTVKADSICQSHTKEGLPLLSESSWIEDFLIGLAQVGELDHLVLRSSLAGPVRVLFLSP